MKVYASPYPEASVKTNESFWQFLLRHNIEDTLPEKVILQEHEHPEKTFTYRSAPKLAAAAAAGLATKLGIQRGDTILLVGKNSLDWLLVEFAALWLGVTAAFGNPTATAHELVHCMEIVEPKVIFCDTGHVMDTVKKALDLREQSKKATIVVGLGQDNRAVSFAFPRDFIKGDKPGPPPLDLSKEDNREQEAVICFSSGTSGLPKGAVLSHHNLLGYFAGSRATDPDMASSEQREVFYAPLGHIYGVFMSILPLYTGGFVRLIRHYSLHEYIKACADVRATVLRMVPSTVVAMVKDPFVRQQDLTSVRTISCAGAVLAPDIITEVRKMTGNVEVVQGYGMTEGSISMLRRSSAQRKQGSVGRLIANVKLRIVDDDLRDVTPGMTGEIIFTSPTVFIDGWMLTGDIGYMDDEGYLWLTDRKKDLIKYKGNQVSPAELESVLLSHPAVTEAGVCATWNTKEDTEMPIGYVNFQNTVHPKDHNRLLQEVLTFVNARVSRNKKLRGGLFYLEIFPRNPTGKLMRRNLPAKLESSRKSKL